MNNLLVGMLLVFLDYNLTAGKHTIGLIPDFIGYIIMVRGLSEMGEQSGRFAKARPIALGLAVYTGILYIMDMFGISIQQRFLFWALGGLSVAASLLVSSQIIAGVRDMEVTQNWDLQGLHLKTLWTYTAVLTGICWVCGWIPVVGTVGAIASIIIHICFLVAFYKTKKLYYAIN